MAGGIAAAVQADGHILANSVAQEEAAPNERNIARRWTEANSLQYKGQPSRDLIYLT